MRLLSELFQNNQEWARRMERDHPGFFQRLLQQQTPEFLWIGCSDSRVPANEITGLLPGEIFVHRNVANIVDPTDRNCLSVIRYAVDVLRVKHIMIVGHYGCGGVKAVIDSQGLGLIDQWLAPIHALRRRYRAFLDACPSDAAKWIKLCELNVLEQACAAWRTPIVSEAWAKGKKVAVHGWIYALHDGRLRDLNVTVNNAAEADEILERALNGILTLS
jgi:carbonic anhydrase